MDTATFFVLVPLVGCALIGLTSIVSVMLAHQRKMAELIRTRELDSARETALQQELASLRQELFRLKASRADLSKRDNREVRA